MRSISRLTLGFQQGFYSPAVWEQERAPDDWTKGIIVKILKKGALSDYNNWRGVTLLSTPFRILTKIIIQWISNAVDQQRRKEHAGFRRGTACADQLFTLRNIIKQCTVLQR